MYVYKVRVDVVYVYKVRVDVVYVYKVEYKLNEMQKSHLHLHKTIRIRCANLNFKKYLT